MRVGYLNRADKSDPRNELRVFGVALFGLWMRVTWHKVLWLKGDTKLAIEFGSTKK